jgi:hypothetical protein
MKSRYSQLRHPNNQTGQSSLDAALLGSKKKEIYLTVFLRLGNYRLYCLHQPPILHIDLQIHSEEHCKITKYHSIAKLLREFDDILIVISGTSTF